MFISYMLHLMIMKKYLFVALLLAAGIILFSANSPKEDSFLKAYIERLQNSEKYLLAVAEAMPEDKYAFKPMPKEMAFAEQLMHILQTVDWQANTLIGGQKAKPESDTTFKVGLRKKAELIASIKQTFAPIIEMLGKIDVKELESNVDFLGNKRTKRQIYLLLLDHITHHRGQMLVYLRMNDVTPPEYAQYQ